MKNVLIAGAFKILEEELNAFMGRKEPEYRNLPPVIISDLVNQKGETAFDSISKRDSLIMTLLNIEEETYGKAQLPYFKKSDDSVEIVNPELKLNLFLLFSAHSTLDDRYLRCLNMISYTALFFQFKHMFDHKNSPGLDENFEKIIIELVSPTLEQQNFIWGALGAKLMPSLLYKLRILALRETDDAPPFARIEEIKQDMEHIK